MGESLHEEMAASIDQITITFQIDGSRYIILCELQTRQLATDRVHHLHHAVNKIRVKYL